MYSERMKIYQHLTAVVSSVGSIPELLNNSNIQYCNTKVFIDMLAKKHRHSFCHLFIMLYKENDAGCCGNEHFQNHKLLKCLTFWNLELSQGWTHLWEIYQNFQVTFPQIINCKGFNIYVVWKNVIFVHS